MNFRNLAQRLLGYVAKAMAYLEYVFYTTQTICFKAAFWPLCVHRGVWTLSDKYLEKRKGKTFKPVGNVRRKQLECFKF